MTYNPSEIVLPKRIFNWPLTNKRIWTDEVTTGHPIRFSFMAPGYVNGWPTMVCQNYHNAGQNFAIQFDAGTDVVFSTVQLSDYSFNKGQTVYFGNDHIMMTNNYQSKGILWNTFLNFPDPFTGLSTGFVTTEPDQSLDYICFPQGGISCATTDGQGFVAKSGFSTGTTRIFDSGAGCPGGNNWGASLIPSYWNFVGPGTYQGTPMISSNDGFVSGPSPLTSTHPDLPALFANNQFPNNCDLGNNLVAMLIGSGLGQGQWGTVLRVYRWYPYISDGGFSNPNHCAVNKIRIGLTLVYERNLLDFINITGATYFWASGLTSPGNGQLVVRVVASGFSNIFDTAVLYFKFPGPVVQPLGFSGTSGNMFGDSTPLNFLCPDGKIAAMDPAGYIFGSLESLDVSLSYKVPARTPPPVPVSALDRNEFIEIKRSI